MTRICPYCCQEINRDTAEARREAVEQTVERMRDWLREQGHGIGFDDSVNEEAAALLLHRAPTTVRNWRSGESPLPYYKVRGRCRYRMADIAFFMLQENFTDCRDVS